MTTARRPECRAGRACGALLAWAGASRGQPLVGGGVLGLLAAAPLLGAWGARMLVT